MSDIKIENLHVSFGMKHVLKGVNLEVADGSSTVIIGGSGSGKSVLLKAIIGLANAQLGRILINGRARNSGITSRCGMLFQGGALFDSLTAWENVVFGLSSHGKSRNELREKAIETLSLVDLGPEVADCYPESLSGGMKKRVSLARTLAIDLDILLLDEPTTGLDPLTADMINNLIVRLHKRMGLTIVTVTHDMRSATSIADNMAMIESGVISWSGDRERFLSSENPRVRSFIEASRF